MEHRKLQAASQVAPARPLAGSGGPHPRPDIHVAPAKMRLRERVAPVHARKQLLTRIHRHAKQAASTPPSYRILADSKSELRRLSVQLLTIQETERQRIAADLHDGIGQSLSLIKLTMETGFRLMESGEDAAALELLRDGVQKIDSAIAELRRTTSDLRPQMLDDLGIVATLSWFFRELRPLCRGKKIETEIAIAESDVSMPAKVAIFRIVQEAINNVIKHANADVVRVSLTRSGDVIQLSIQDNGMGFDRGPKSKCGRCGLGLLTMKQRALCCGGTFELESAPGLGTRVVVDWPVAEGARRDPPHVPERERGSTRTETRHIGPAHRMTRHARGFTLLELLVVMVIIGLLAGYVGPKYFSQIGKSQIKTARAQIDALGKALDQFRLDTGHYPTTEEGLRALVTRPSNEPKWDGPYLTKDVPLDPWGDAYVFKIPGTHGEYDLMSYGKDGRPGGDGEAADITNW